MGGSGILFSAVARLGNYLSISIANLGGDWEPPGKREQSVRHLCIPHQLTAPAVLAISSQL